MTERAKVGEERELQELVETWRKYVAEDPDECKWCNGYAHGLTLAADELAEILARHAPAREGWIDVKERMPKSNPKKAWADRDGSYECSEEVIAFNGSQHVAELLTNPKGESCWVSGDSEVKGVTCWREMFEPPARHAVNGEDKHGDS